MIMMHICWTPVKPGVMMGMFQGKNTIKTHEIQVVCATLQRKDR